MNIIFSIYRIRFTVVPVGLAITRLVCEACETSMRHIPTPTVLHLRRWKNAGERSVLARARDLGLDLHVPHRGRSMRNALSEHPGPLPYTPPHHTTTLALKRAPVSERLASPSTHPRPSPPLLSTSASPSPHHRHTPPAVEAPQPACSPSLVCTSCRKSARIWFSRFCFSS